ncbi:glycosyl hydrolase [Staphylotrichum tortipilum]|uniref:non-reducing end alpha-L-arabinofuranosidase n=1 Tax=Staphylotrichum tortipilum TaxID=2831512 RepID=A0AAN6RR87_9PEZI|nr:glycosyl hydrolase [Staphylotrichum longicolle]
MQLPRRILAAAAAVLATVCLAAASPAVSYVNPLIPQRADPHISKQSDGYYYFTATVPEYDRIILRRAQTIQALASAPETTIWRRKASGVGSGQVWAPELHAIDGKWYIYVALGVSGQWKIRASVLEGTGTNPLTASWTEKGVIKTNWDTFSLDATTFVANGTRYLVWAQQEPSRSDENSSLLIAALQNPWTLRLPAVAISRPTLAWERVGYKVNEGPAVLQRNGALFLTYSASATDANYCMGLLTASLNSDLLNPASWTKSPTPILTSNAATSQFGPGHNSFVVAEDGQTDLLVYHDRGYRDIKGDPLNDPNRRTRVQKLYWGADGKPEFGVPVADGETPVRLRAAAGGFVRYDNGTGASGWLPETLFRVVKPGLAGGTTVSLEPGSNPGVFLSRGQGRAVQFVRNGTGGSAAAASFERRAGLGDAGGVSFEAVDVKGEYLRLEVGGKVAVAGVGKGEEGLATFFLE